jgi:hypothetical protein
MAYNKNLKNKIREQLADHPVIEEKKYVRLEFMVNKKMCVGVIKDEMMCRIDPEIHKTLVEITGCRTMDFAKSPMIGYVMIDDSGMRTQKDFEYWIGLALEYNKKVKSSKKKK